MSYLSPTKVIDDQNFILWELPAGKIDRKNPNNRVTLPRQKGGTCWYYAFKRIMTEGDLEQETAFRFYSKVRKKLTLLDEKGSFEISNVKAIFETALQEIGIDPKVEYATKVQTVHPVFKIIPWEKLSEVEQTSKMQAMLLSSLIKRCKLRISNWEPRHKIETLIHGLKKNGPYQFNGHLGQPSYRSFPGLYKQVKEHNIFGWKPGERNQDLNAPFHAIVVVGAEKGEKGELVYFIDPNDASDPTNPSTQRIYVTSYRSFKSSLSDLGGSLEPGATSSPFHFGVFAKEAKNAQASDVS